MVIANQSGEKIIYPNQKILPVGVSKRIKKTALTFVKSAAVTFVFSLIPILHFVLVPVGILVTFWSTLSTWKRFYIFENFELHCPSCDQKSSLPISGHDLPLRTFCVHCRNMIYINN